MQSTEKLDDSETYLEGLDELTKIDKSKNKNEDEPSKSTYLALSYRLGEEINNGILFFGQVKVIKKRTTCVAICHCGNAWRVSIDNIKSGRTKSCGCRS